MSAFDVTTVTLKKDGGTATLALKKRDNGDVFYDIQTAAKAAGSAVFSGLPTVADTLVITDGLGNSETFEFESGGGVTAGNVSVTIGGTGTLTADAFVTALATTNLALVGVNTTGTVALTHKEFGVIGNSATVDASSATNVAGTSPTGGVDGVWQPVANNDDVKKMWDALSALDV